MRYDSQENTAWTSYDTILPPDARDEMLKPKRPSILRRPAYQPPDRSGILKWVGAFALVAIILVGAIAHISHGARIENTRIPE